MAGKFRNPLLQVLSHTLLWDDEWRPEGIALPLSYRARFRDGSRHLAGKRYRSGAAGMGGRRARRRLQPGG